MAALFVAHFVLFPNLSIVKILPVFFGILAILATIYYWLRAKYYPAAVSNELTRIYRFAQPIGALCFALGSIWVALSQWFGASVFQTGFGFAMLIAFSTTQLQYESSRVFRGKFFKLVYAPCLVVAALGSILGLLHNAT